MSKKHTDSGDIHRKYRDRMEQIWQEQLHIYAFGFQAHGEPPRDFAESELPKGWSYDIDPDKPDLSLGRKEFEEFDNKTLLKMMLQTIKDSRMFFNTRKPPIDGIFAEVTSRRKK